MDANSSGTETGAGAPGLVVDVVSDVVCPWCFIGKRKLERALETHRAKSGGIKASIRWHPFQLNPDLGAEGVDRAAYLERKFGGASRASEVYARVTAAGHGEGIEFAFDRIARQPNTLDAHRLVAWAQGRSDAEPLVEALFRAYFIQGRFIGDRSELASIAAECGLDGDAARDFLASTALEAEVSREDREARDVGVQGVPFFIFNGRTAVSGAHEPATLIEALDASLQPA
jgi:predicted DsbA family dithiol-disulfide isomerase